MLTDPLPGILDGHVRELAEAEASLPTHMAVPMLKESSAVLADPEVQANAFGIGILGFSAGAFGIVGWDGLYGAFGEGESLGLTSHFGSPFLNIGLGILWGTARGLAFR